MDNYTRIADTLTWLAEHHLEQPSLATMAARANLSETHFQKVFTHWAGVSPKKFLQFLTLDSARKALDDSQSVFDASMTAGLSGPSRLHDLFVRVESLSPGEYKNGGEDLEIVYGFHATPFGQALLMVSHRGITALSFVHAAAPQDILTEAKSRLPKATYRQQPETTEPLISDIFRTDAPRGTKLQLLLSGTEFQLLVWRALLEIPEGACTSYGQLAQYIGRANAQRAVGTAVGRNPIACVIPCHRVIRQTGLNGGYRWGAGRKLALLGLERLRSESKLTPDRAMV